MKLHTKWISGTLAISLGFVSVVTHAEEDSFFTLGVGYEFSTGKYGTTSSTDIVTVPVTALYESGPWSLKLTVPYLRITGVGDVIVSSRSGGMHGTSTTTTTTVTKSTTRSGLGDVATMLTYNLYSGEEYESGIDLSGRIKFGTASTALGTGENDYAVQMYFYHDVGNFTPSILFGYEMLGSTDQLLLNNVYYGALGSSYSFSDQASAGAEYRYSQQASATAAEQRELTLYANYQIGADVFLRGYLMKGYTTASPDSGYGLSVAAVF